LFRSINKNGVVWGEGLTEKVIWYVVKNFAKTVGIEKVAPHDLRRTCARICHVSGGEQIQFLLALPFPAPGYDQLAGAARAACPC
jgi:integrase